MYNCHFKPIQKCKIGSGHPVWTYMNIFFMSTSLRLIWVSISNSNGAYDHLSTYDRDT